MIELRVENWQSPLLSDLAELLSEQSQLSGVITAKVISADQVRRLNSQYAGLDIATDVLSFPYITRLEVGGSERRDENPKLGRRAPADLGDVVISRQHISSQAETAGTDEQTEFLLLLTHGALHVLGFDHSTPKQCRRMDQIQAGIMQALGLKYRNFGWQD